MQNAVLRFQRPHYNTGIRLWNAWFAEKTIFFISGLPRHIDRRYRPW